MSVAELFVRHLGYRFWLARRGESAILKYYREFLPLWTADRQELDARNIESMRAILRHATKTTNYYRSCFTRYGFDPESVSQCSDISKLPFLTKDDLNRDMDSIMSNSFVKEDLVKSSTGGSTGLALTFYRDCRTTSLRRAQDHLFNASIGVYPGTKRAWVWGSPLDVFSPQSLKAKIGNFLSERAIHFYSFDATPASIGDFLAQLNKHRPKVIFAYPNMLATMAEFARDQRIGMNPISKVVVTAEAVYDWQRRLFKDVFGAETYERYGSRETGTFASEGYDHAGMHIFEPGYHFEVIDTQGNPVPEGEMGELVLTDFYNHAMPMIRYRTGDLVKIDSSPCPCGCAWRRIVAIGGRTLDMIVRPDGSRISGLVIVALLQDARVESRVQVVQTLPDSLTVRHLASDIIPFEARANLKRELDQVFGVSVNISYQPVEELTYDKSGKYRYVICECGGNVNAVNH